MTSRWLLLGALLLPVPAAAQQAEAEVLAVLTELFDGLRARDTARMGATLHPAARLVSAGERAGTPAVRVDEIGAWLGGIAGAPPGLLDERLRNTVVRVDGGLASVWTEYVFYVGERLSHCGVDALHLVRTEQGWKIIDLADTRRREGCAP